MPATITKLVTASGRTEAGAYSNGGELRDELTLPVFTLKIGELFEVQ